MYCISDTVETAVGLKLTGVETAIVSNQSELDINIEKVLKDKDIGILIITEKIYDLSKERFDEIQDKYRLPLLVKI